MKKDRLDVAYICSVSPVELKEDIVMKYPVVDKDNNAVVTEDGHVLYGNMFTFTIPATKKGSHVVIPVYDGAALIRDPTSYETGQSVLMERPQSALKIAKAILNDLTGHDIGSPSGYNVGVGIIEGPEPTEEELATLEANRDGWCLYLVRQADSYYNRPETRWMITDTHKAAAEAIDIGHSPDHPWIRSIKPGDNKQCIACQEYIPTRALVCPKCQTNLLDFVEKAGLTLEYVKVADSFLHGLLDKSTTPKKVTKKPTPVPAKANAPVGQVV